MYYTLQGEGFHSGRPAVFVRFAGCNLWSGLEKDRDTAKCNFCDTDFFGTDGERGGSYTAEELRQGILELWPSEEEIFIVFTGGEPMLQVDLPLIRSLKELNVYLAIETNGTKEVPKEIDWICVSPKPNCEIIQQAGNELKLVYPQVGMLPEQFVDWDFEFFYLQALDGPFIQQNLTSTMTYCMEHPEWRLSVQLHKILGIA